MADVLPAVSGIEGPGVEAALRVAWRAAGLVGSIAELLVEARLTASSTTAYADRSNRTARSILERHGVRVEPVGPRPVGRAVLVANHVSYLDPLVVSSIVPCLSVAKGETRRWPLVGPGLAELGVLFVRRGDPYSGAVTLRRALRALGDGVAVLNFPEGTTTDGRSVGPFLRGAFGLARLARAPLVPARIDYDHPGVPWFGGASFAPHYARLARVPRVGVRVRFGAPIHVAEHDEPEEVARRAHGVISSLAT
jgi:1-acyl-sn-glycerol-3-phosphate acyltransferase